VTALPQALAAGPLVPALVFVATYAVLAVGRPPLLRIDRTGAAIIGAILMVTVGGLPLESAWRAVDYRTLILLFGMMILVAHLQLARFFSTLARATVGAIRHPAALLLAVVFAAGALSALFVNDTVCLVFTPVLLEVAAARRHRPLPYLLALATASNIGSVATITGNPQNMLIASVSGIGYRPFAAALVPVAVVGLALDAAVIWLLFRRDLHAGAFEERTRVGTRAVHRAMLAKSLLVTAAVVAAFVAGVDTALVSAGAAAVLLVTRRVKPEKVYRQVDWGLLALFVGLFVVVAGIERVGLDRRAFELLQPLGIDAVPGLCAVSALLSNLISNVPAVMLFTRIVPHLPDPTTSWLALAMSSTLAGNLTLVGSIANLIVAEGARRRGVAVSFLDHLKVGLPVTALTIAFGIWWLS
jgi:Na+/H+ antiporter NhaD/arsenite permease-like protein